jgi:putative hydrolase of the HAD superfamily
VNTTSRSFQCIAFDAVGTIIHPSPPAGDVYSRVAQEFGSRLPPDEIARRFRKAFRETEQGDLAAPVESRLITSEAREKERWRQIVATVIDDVPDSSLCFTNLFAHFARPCAWACYADVPGVLAHLKSAGYRLALASNFDRRLHAVCDGIAALRQFDLRIISSEVGCRKPGRAFFDALVRNAGCRSEEILMVGDDVANDVTGARQAGLTAVHLDRGAAPDRETIGNLNELPEWLAGAFLVVRQFRSNSGASDAGRAP